MDLNNLSTAKAKLGLVVHNHPGHKPHLRQRYAVAAGQDIKEGQLVSVIKNDTDGRLEFIRGFDIDIDGGGAAITSLNDLIAVAYQSSDDGDVANSGKLTGLSSVGGFEISTAYFQDVSYEAGDLLIPDGTTGNFMPFTSTTTTNDFTEADTDVDVDTYAIARVVADYAPPVDFAPVYTANPGTDAGVSPGVTGAVWQAGRRYGATDLRMLRIELIPPRPVTVTGAV